MALVMLGELALKQVGQAQRVFASVSQAGGTP